jgi:moderate conductance mechanosensitive channel
MKIMIKPGEQFVIRRLAYSLIKKAVDADGIKFAFPTVRGAGGGDKAAPVGRAQSCQNEPTARPFDIVII